jgi:hypothetical protein
MWLVWFKQEKEGSTTQEGKKRPLANCDLEDILYRVVNIHQEKDQEGKKKLSTNLLNHLLKNSHIYIYVVVK